jgi:hypothetical protein
MAVFYGFFNFYKDSMISANLTGVNELDSTYNSTYSDMWNKTFDINEKITNIRDGLSDVTDAKSSATDILYGGVTGIANVLLLPLSLITTILEIFNMVVAPFYMIPDWALMLGSMAILLLLVYAVARGATGRIEL